MRQGIRLIRIAVLAAVLVVVAGAARGDPLESWNQGASRRAILEFVRAVADRNNPEWVPPSERIAVFDNDGTLLAEKPLFFQSYFILARIRAMAPDHPEWKDTPPFKAILEKEWRSLTHLPHADLGRLLVVTHTGLSQEAFERQARDFLRTALHPDRDVPFTRLAYRPMKELIRYLQGNDFKVFIVSGGGTDFIRAYSEEVYGIPRENVIGNAFQAEYRPVNGRPTLMRLPEAVRPLNNRRGKPVRIARHIGRRPILAFGNSDNDIPMLQYAEGEGRRLSLLLRHDDGAREYAYTERAERALEMAGERGWITVSMKEDFRRVFDSGPNEKDR